MPRDPLDTVRRLRHRAVDEERRSLAESLAVAADAEAQARTAERHIEQEAERASDPSGDDALVEAFAAWLPGARHRAAQARALVERHEAEVSRRRAELAGCHTALAAIDGLIEQRRAAGVVAEQRSEQIAMDEAASRAPGLRGEEPSNAS